MVHYYYSVLPNMARLPDICLSDYLSISLFLLLPLGAEGIRETTRLGCELTISTFERWKTVQSSDREANVTNCIFKHRIT
jgi:hypothetical protein